MSKKTWADVVRGTENIIEEKKPVEQKVIEVSGEQPKQETGIVAMLSGVFSGVLGLIGLGIGAAPSSEKDEDFEDLGEEKEEKNHKNVTNVNKPVVVESRLNNTYAESMGDMLRSLKSGETASITSSASYVAAVSNLTTRGRN